VWLEYLLSRDRKRIKKRIEEREKEGYDKKRQRVTYF
jgi:hypothetical protein